MIHDMSKYGRVFVKHCMCISFSEMRIVVVILACLVGTAISNSGAARWEDLEKAITEDIAEDVQSRIQKMTLLARAMESALEAIANGQPEADFCSAKRSELTNIVGHQLASLETFTKFLASFSEVCEADTSTRLATLPAFTQCQTQTSEALKLALLSVPTDSRNALGRSDVMYQPLCLPAVALANAVLAGAVELKRK